ncbi:golgin subfamily A member 7B [Poecilia reticulata]|uniref:golgin subfamily A member 7B n=1 Tax=Poecilia reticulata TaxID=8081 RepID=UPI0004A2E277|nr:PREDICTED: golgin subfamily A member 7B [Poecilia reticulata]
MTQSDQKWLPCTARTASRSLADTRQHVHGSSRARCSTAAAAAAALSRTTRANGVQHGTDPAPSHCSMATEFHNLQDMQRTASLVTKVFIQRDYSEGTVCRFQTKFPAELDNRVERALLEQTVKTLNSCYVEAEKVGGQSYLEGCLACATAYIVFLCMETRYEKVLKKISGYIQEQNEKIYAPRGLLLTDPIERGMRVLEISVFEDRGSSGSSPSSSMSSCSTAR